MLPRGENVPNILFRRENVPKMIPRGENVPNMLSRGRICQICLRIPSGGDYAKDAH